MNLLEYNRWDIHQFINIIDKVINTEKSSWTEGGQKKGNIQEDDQSG
jgi:hypothetical protein